LQLVDEFRFVTAPRERTGPIGHCRPFRPVEFRILTGCYPGLPDGTTLDRELEE
jgi:hypothetical protein